VVYRQTVALIGSILLECLTSGIYKAVDLVPFKFANRLRGGGGVGLQLNETRSRLSFPVSSLLHRVFLYRAVSLHTTVGSKFKMLRKTVKGKLKLSLCLTT
jgi:hypothetical protein